MPKPKPPPTIIEMRSRRISAYPTKWGEAKTYEGRVAEALIVLTNAKHWGVHKTEFKPDVFARLEQAGIEFQFFARITCGSSREDWVRLTVDTQIIEKPKKVAAQPCCCCGGTT